MGSEEIQEMIKEIRKILSQNVVSASEAEKILHLSIAVRNLAEARGKLRW